MQFNISKEDSKRVKDWLEKEVWPDGTRPYEGAIGGGITYEFTPTGLGIVTIVRYGDHELNLTDYSSW